MNTSKSISVITYPPLYYTWQKLAAMPQVLTTSVNSTNKFIRQIHQLLESSMTTFPHLSTSSSSINPVKSTQKPAMSSHSCRAYIIRANAWRVMMYPSACFICKFLTYTNPLHPHSSLWSRISTTVTFIPLMNRHREIKSFCLKSRS